MRKGLAILGNRDQEALQHTTWPLPLAWPAAPGRPAGEHKADSKAAKPQKNTWAKVKGRNRGKPLRLANVCCTTKDIVSDRGHLDKPRSLPTVRRPEVSNRNCLAIAAMTVVQGRKSSDDPVIRDPSGLTP